MENRQQRREWTTWYITEIQLNRNNEKRTWSYEKSETITSKFWSWLKQRKCYTYTEHWQIYYIHWRSTQQISNKNKQELNNK